MDIEPFINDLKSASPFTRSNAVRKLGKVADPRAVALIVPMLEDRHKEVRVAAVVALGELGDGRAIQPLIAMWRREEERKKAFADPEDAEPETVSAALIAMTLTKQFGSQAVGALIANIDFAGALITLAGIGDPRAADALLAVLDELGITMRHVWAAVALGEIGDPRALSRLENMKHLQGPIFERAALEAIQKIKQRDKL